MIKKYQKILLLIISSLVVALPVFALEVNYPYIPGAGGGPGAQFTLNNFIRYIFIFIILSAGAIGMIAIAVSGVQILMSFGNPAQRGAAMERIRNALLGIGLLLSSVVILTTINPGIVTIDNRFSGLTSGFYLRSPHAVDPEHPDPYEYRQAPDSMENTSDEPANTEIFNYCAPSTKPRNLLVWTYDMVGYKPYGNATTEVLKCNDPGISIKAPVLSFETQVEEPGIYFYGTGNCTGLSSKVQKISGPIDYYGFNIGSIKIISGDEKDERYGVVLDKESGGLESGECSEPLIKFDPGEACWGAGGTDPFPKDLSGADFVPFYAEIIKYSPDHYASSNVQFDSKNLFARLDQQGSSLVPPTGARDYNIGDLYIYNADDPSSGPVDGNVDQLIREQWIWDNMLYTDGPYEDECCIKEDSDLDCSAEDPHDDPDNLYAEKINSCLKGVTINGSYDVFLYSKNNRSGDRMCQSFWQDWDDIPNQTELFTGGKKIYKVVVVPRI